MIYVVWSIDLDTKSTSLVAKKSSLKSARSLVTDLAFDSSDVTRVADVARVTRVARATYVTSDSRHQNVFFVVARQTAIGPRIETFYYPAMRDDFSDDEEILLQDRVHDLLRELFPLDPFVVGLPKSETRH